MIMAAIDGHAGEPGEFRDYKLKQIMVQNSDAVPETENVPAAV